MSDYLKPSLGALEKSAATSAPSCTDDECFARLLSLLKTYGENPLEGLAGYLVTEDPTYLPEHSEIKMLIRSMGRDELLRHILLRALNSDPASKEV